MTEQLRNGDLIAMDARLSVRCLQHQRDLCEAAPPDEPHVDQISREPVEQLPAIHEGGEMRVAIGEDRKGILRFDNPNLLITEES
jgi:hypothetical protein